MDELDILLKEALLAEGIFTSNKEKNKLKIIKKW